MFERETNKYGECDEKEDNEKGESKTVSSRGCGRRVRLPKKIANPCETISTKQSENSFEN